MDNQCSPVEPKTSCRTTSERSDPEARYWIAYARGANFEDLKQHGFTVFYPTVDDYAFLRAVPKNLALVGRCEALGLQYFLWQEGELVEVRWAELAGVSELAVQSIGPGDPVEVVRGTAEGLTGRVIKLTETGILVRVQSYKRSYELEVDGLDLVLIKP